MPCLFVRIFHDKRSFKITEDVTPGCEWVLAGEGVATIKWDGTACMVKDGRLYKRYDAKRDRKTGEFKSPPPGSIPCCEPDEETGHWPHWVEIRCDKPEDQHHISAQADCPFWPLPDGTYELCGPKVQGNPHGFDALLFLRHGADKVPAPRTFAGLREFLRPLHHEGIVFHHPDGRMCKIRRSDFGFSWPVVLP